MLFICLSIKLWESDFFLNKGNLNFRANFGEIIISGFVLLPFPLFQMIISCTMAGTGNGPEVLNRSPGPVTCLQLDRKIKCDVCEALIVPTSYKRHKKAIHNDNSLEKQ